MGQNARYWVGLLAGSALALLLVAAVSIASYRAIGQPAPPAPPAFSGRLPDPVPIPVTGLAPCGHRRTLEWTDARGRWGRCEIGDVFLVDHDVWVPTHAKPEVIPGPRQTPVPEQRIPDHPLGISPRP